MNIKEVISSGILESYVLGTASKEEVAMVNDLCKKYPEVLTEIEAIEESLMRLSEENAPPLKAELKNKIFSQLNIEMSATVIPIKKEKENTLSFYKFGIAASLLLFFTSLAYNILMQKKLDELNGEIVVLNSARSVLAEQMQMQQASMAMVYAELSILSNPDIKTVALKGMHQMENKSAMVHWNQTTKEVYFNMPEMPSTPEGQQYQLWAIVNGKPVDAGMVELKGDSVFQKMKSVEGAEAFAITIEKAGGSASPTMEAMVLMGKV